MRNLFKIILFIILFFSSEVFTQTFTISGSVKELDTNQPLAFANIQIADKTLGAATNVDGKYILKLEKGNYKLITTYLGYVSDTLTIDLEKDISGMDFLLKKSSVSLPEKDCAKTIPGLSASEIFSNPFKDMKTVLPVSGPPPPIVWAPSFKIPTTL